MEDEGRESQVNEQMVRLERSCERLSSAIKKLENRCASVLNPEIGPEATDELKACTLCPLADELRGHARHIECACGQLGVLTERIEL